MGATSVVRSGRLRRLEHERARCRRLRWKRVPYEPLLAFRLVGRIVLNPKLGELGKMADSHVAVGNGPHEQPKLMLGSFGLHQSFMGALPTDSPAYIVAKRCLDVVLASLALILLAPLLLAVALAIRLEGHGPIIYRQPRIGLRGRRFAMLKFRTMRADRRGRHSEIEFDDRRISLKTDRDPRVTRVGRILRLTSIDELPQLINVINGDMSLVGPRREQPEMLKYYRPEHYQRHVVLPGLTGWWQINSRCERGTRVVPSEDLETKLRDDTYYLNHRSFWLDLWILARTAAVVLLRRGAI